MARRKPNETPRHAARRPIKGMIVRGWALVLLALVAWSGYVAFAYLIKVVFAPAHVPEAITDWEGAITADTLETEALGTTDRAPRAPVGHYHGVDHWYQPDPMQTCTTSGCHTLLPHKENKASRAFANFHATFLTCQMCHDKRAVDTDDIRWVNLETGSPQKTPALLQLIAWLDANETAIRESPDDAHAVVRAGLTQTLQDMNDDELLGYLNVQIDTSEPGSPVWRAAIQRLRADLPGHRRGEYNAKLAPVDLYDASYRDTQRDLARRYAAAGPDGDDAIRQQLHDHVLARPDACLSCHSRPTRLNYRELGYTQDAIDQLLADPMVQMIQQNREGRPFYLPNLLEDEE